MSGALNMNSNAINSLTDPMSNQDATTKNCVDIGNRNCQHVGGSNLVNTSSIGNSNNIDVNIIRNEVSMINVYNYVVNINNNCYFSFNNNTTSMIGTTDIAT